MRVAQLRGCGFFQDTKDGRWAPHTGLAFKALDDVAAALGYKDRTQYNWACVERPAQVERRLKALKA